MINMHRLRSRQAGLTSVSALFLLVLWPASAFASDSVLWDWATISGGNVVAGGISAADDEGGGGRGLALTGAPVNHPLGVAIDSATGALYWANFGAGIDYCQGVLQGPNTISYARLDGTSGGTLNTSGATLSGPDGVAIDPAAGRLYWANEYGNTISYANLDGTGGHDLNTAGATVRCPAGVVVDPALGRVYWTNFEGNAISYANLDGSGGGDLRTGGATVDGPWGLAIDAANNRVYWANNHASRISYAALDGTSAGDLNTHGATVQGPWGVSIDPSEGRVYWANNLRSTISWANVDGSGGGDLDTSGAPVDHPKYAALIQTPSGVAAPTISGGSTTGSTLFCSAGSWAPDLPESFLYREPQQLAYSWSKNGTPIAQGSNTIAASGGGTYTCQVTGSNYAGSSSQTSTAFSVVRPRSDISLTSKALSSGGSITVGLLVHARGRLVGTATFSTGGPRTAVYGRTVLAAAAAGPLTLTLRPTSAAWRRLVASRTLRLTLALVFTAWDGRVSWASRNLSVRAPSRS